MGKKGERKGNCSRKSTGPVVSEQNRGVPTHPLSGVGGQLQTVIIPGTFKKC